MSEFTNTTAIDFSLQDQNETMHTLADYAGKYVLLYFYPKDMTPTCTIEAQTFRDSMNDLVGTNIQVLGVSADTCQSHKKFAEKHQLNFPLLADTEMELVNAYGLYKEKTLFGKKGMGIARESFLINPDGIIVKHYEKVKAKTHPAQVLADVQALESGAE